SVCVYPARLHGLELRSLQEQQFTCDGPLELPVLQLIPTQRQLVFRGDRLPLQCTASYLDPSVRLSWSHEQRPVHTLEDRGLYVEDSIIHDCCLITSELILSNIDAGVSGNWQCHVTSSRGNSSIGMEIVVLETTALYCAAERVSSNKGDFRWPKTLAGFMAFLPCAVSSSSSAPQEKRAWSRSDSTSQEKRAWRRCDRMGRWAEHDYNQCSYVSQFTRSLHELTQMSVNVSSALALAQQLSSLTSRAALFGDMMDVIFVTHLVERLTRLVDHVRELADHVLDVASNMMAVEEHVLWMAQNEARACSRIVQCVERIADLSLSTNTTGISKVSANIALEALALRPDSLMGLLCTVMQRAPLLPPVANGGHSGAASEHNTLLNFTCHTVNISGSPMGQLNQNTLAIASIHFPLAGPRSGENCTCKLQLIVFRNGKLFPCTGNSSNLADDGKRRSVSTPVAFTKLGFEEGAVVPSISGRVPASGGVRLHSRHAALPVCLHHHLHSAPQVFTTIRISRKGWHMLLNFCFHTALTFAVFAGGINRIKYPIICQAVGIVLHYSSLSTMLWLGVTARNIYKQVSKKPQKAQNGDHAPPHPARSPMLRFYLVSAGVPFIICGITAAINIENYGSGEQTPFCWMAWEPSLGAFYGPVGFIVLVTCVYFLCTFIQLHKHPERKYELKAVSEEQQRLSDLHQGEPASSQCHGGCPGLINPSTLANEHSFKAQLRTAAFTLFLFAATWTFGALAVSQGHFLDMIFSCLYGAFSVTLGLFVLIHHCAKRDDVWHCWCACCPGRRPSNAYHAHSHAHKVNINGDAHSHCHLDAGKPAHCTCRTATQNHVTCLTPVSPCCAALHTQQLLEDETSAHVLLHADPEGYRPAMRLHRCSKPVRTKTRRQRELAFRIPSDGASAHSSRANSPHTHICHLAHEGHHVCPHEALTLCHHHHMCCAKDELLDTGESFQCGKLTGDDLHHAHIELHARRQSLANQNGILKGSVPVHEALLYPPDSTGNIRTGPWRNETTV
ncbi:adhesion G protein-coupled receptor A3-like, partial [Sinocyclocheilus rhinocerous]|uniref:adhesion G protein-coupled receptor A3-like n=1 Tax=Sinocyclocheilus rhinocerous TaxID=307959 RepID=UPI0007B7A119